MPLLPMTPLRGLSSDDSSMRGIFIALHVRPARSWWVAGEDIDPARVRADRRQGSFNGRAYEDRAREVLCDGRGHLEVNKPQPIVLFEVARGWLTGHTPEIGEMHRIEK